MPDQNCLFCRIVRREIKAEIVAEEDSLTAFKDITPQAPTHLLIIPNEHLPTLADAKDEQASKQELKTALDEQTEAIREFSREITRAVNIYSGE